MTALELIDTVRSAGGMLTLNGEKIRATIPEDAAHLVDLIRAQRGAVIQVLHQRREALARWIATSCVCRKGVCTNPKFAYRQYQDWASGAVSYGEFIHTFEARGYRLESDGMIEGLCLAVDFLAACEWEARQQFLM